MKALQTMFVGLFISHTWHDGGVFHQTL
jgi:hypothetical protein